MVYDFPPTGSQGSGKKDQLHMAVVWRRVTLAQGQLLKQYKWEVGFILGEDGIISAFDFFFIMLSISTINEVRQKVTVKWAFEMKCFRRLKPR